MCVIWQKASIRNLLCRVCIALLLWGARVFHFLLKVVHMAPACPPAFWFLKSLKHSVSHGIADTSPCVHVWHRLATCHQGRHTQSQEVVSGGPMFSGVPVKKALPLNILKHSCSGRRKCPCLSHRAGLDIKTESFAVLYTIFSFFSACCTTCGMQVALAGIAEVLCE